MIILPEVESDFVSATLEYSQLPPPKAPDAFRQRAFAALAMFSFALWLTTITFAVRSYAVAYPTSDPITGAATTSPPWPTIALPIPSDAAEFWVPLRGTLERWEYAPWEGRWYRLRQGVNLPLWLPLVMFLIVPAMWIVRKRQARLTQ